MGLGRKIPEVKYHSHPIVSGYMLAARLMTVDINLDCLAEGVFVRLCPVELLLSPFSMLSSVDGSRHAQPTPKQWGVVCPILGGSIDINY